MPEYDCNNLGRQYSELCQAINDVAGKQNRLYPKGDQLDLISMKKAKKLLEQRIKNEISGRQRNTDQAVDQYIRPTRGDSRR